MNELFLICALTLPVASFNPMTMANQKSDLFKKIGDFVRHVVPGAKVVLVPAGKRPLRKDLEKLPLIIDGKDIYIKRPDPKKRAIEVSA